MLLNSLAGSQGTELIVLGQDFAALRVPRAAKMKGFRGIPKYPEARDGWLGQSAGQITQPFAYVCVAKRCQARLRTVAGALQRRLVRDQLQTP